MDDRRDELRQRPIDGESVPMSNQDVIESAYLIQEHLKPLIEDQIKLSPPRARCYRRRFYRVRGWLRKVPIVYYPHHLEVARWFLINRELSNRGNRLHWVYKEGCSLGEFTPSK